MIEVVKRLLCDRCAAPGPDVRTLGQVRALAELGGWVCVSWYGDTYHLCPACAAGESRPLNPPRGARFLPVLDVLTRTMPALGAVARQEARA